jgi:hypothetical protein
MTTAPSTPAAVPPTGNGTRATEPLDEPPDRGSEPTDERLEREHEQLFHELRAIIPGAQVLFAFMLTITFTQRFEQLTGVQRSVYYGTLLCAGIALLLLLAPASFHRLRFRRHDKEVMMRIANVETIAALVLISVSVAGTIFLITDVMYSTEIAAAVGAAIWLCTGALWWGLPLQRTWKGHVGAATVTSTPRRRPSG